MFRLESVLCSHCGGRGEIYAGSSFSACGVCGGQGRVLKARSSLQAPTSKPQRAAGNRSKPSSSGGRVFVGIVILAVLGLAAWRYITEQALPALSQSWPWVIWYVTSFVLAFGVMLVRAHNLNGLSFLPEIILATLVITKLFIADFWSVSTTNSPTLSSLFLLSCFAASIFFKFYRREPWLSKKFPVSQPEESAFIVLILYFPLLAVLFLISVLATPLEFWDAWAWVKPYILPSFAVIYPPCVAYFYRSCAYFVIKA